MAADRHLNVTKVIQVGIVFFGVSYVCDVCLPYLFVDWMTFVQEQSRQPSHYGSTFFWCFWESFNPEHCLKTSCPGWQIYRSPLSNKKLFRRECVRVLRRKLVNILTLNRVLQIFKTFAHFFPASALNHWCLLCFYLLFWFSWLKASGVSRELFLIFLSDFDKRRTLRPTICLPTHN